MMIRIAAATVTALFIACSPLAYAQDHPAKLQERLSEAEPGDLTDLRVEMLKDALQLTPDQEKYWPAVEEAIRTRAKHRLARLENYAERASELRDSHPLEVALDRNPVDFLHERADALAQRAGDVKRLADAWEPLYETLSPDQKRRMSLLRIFVLGDVINGMSGPQVQFYDQFYDEE
jgi:hypothetical protein